jgi:hypothetical protein
VEKTFIFSWRALRLRGKSFLPQRRKEKGVSCFELIKLNGTFGVIKNYESTE